MVRPPWIINNDLTYRAWMNLPPAWELMRPAGPALEAEIYQLLEGEGRLRPFSINKFLEANELLEAGDAIEVSLLENLA